MYDKFRPHLYAKMEDWNYNHYDFTSAKNVHDSVMINRVYLLCFGAVLKYNEFLSGLHVAFSV